MSKEPGYPPTPELDRMKAVQTESQTLGQFLDWLDEQGMYLTVQHTHQGSPENEPPDGCWAPHQCTSSCICDNDPKKKCKEGKCFCRDAADNLCGRRDGELCQILLSKENLLAKYFEIDLTKSDLEKQAILEWIQMTPKQRLAAAGKK